jgi:hypothetical protein
MGVRQRGASAVTSSRSRHPSRVHAAHTAGALRRGLTAAGSSAAGILSARFAPPLTPLTASNAPSHATSIAS